MDDLQKKTDDELRDIVRASTSNMNVPSSIYHRARQELEFRETLAGRQSGPLTRTAEAVLGSLSRSKLGTDMHGKFITTDILEHQFGEHRMPKVEEALRELIEQDLVEKVEDNDGVFRLTPFGASHESERRAAAAVSYSNISNSNIAHQSNNVTQSIQLSDLPMDIQEKIREFDAAVGRKDAGAMKRAFGYIADKAVDVAIALGTGALLR